MTAPLAFSEQQRELRRLLHQTVVEVDQGLQVAEAELRSGQLMNARSTVKACRALLPALEDMVARLAQRWLVGA